MKNVQQQKVQKSVKNSNSNKNVAAAKLFTTGIPLSKQNVWRRRDSMMAWDCKTTMIRKPSDANATPVLVKIYKVENWKTKKRHNARPQKLERWNPVRLQIDLEGRRVELARQYNANQTHWSITEEVNQREFDWYSLLTPKSGTRTKNSTVYKS